MHGSGKEKHDARERRINISKRCVVVLLSKTGPTYRQCGLKNTKIMIDEDIDKQIGATKSSQSYAVLEMNDI